MQVMGTSNQLLVSGENDDFGRQAPHSVHSITNLRLRDHTKLEEMWQLHNTAVLSALHRSALVLSGDARCDNPGRCASMGTYSLLDDASGVIIAEETIHVTEVANSYWLEIEGVKRTSKEKVLLCCILQSCNIILYTIFGRAFQFSASVNIPVCLFRHVSVSCFRLRDVLQQYMPSNGMR